MSFWETLLEFVRALAWPLVVLTAVVLFRGQVVELLARLRRVSHGETAVEFGEQALETQLAVAGSVLGTAGEGDQVAARRAALERIVERAAEIGRLRGLDGAASAVIDIDWSQDPPRVEGDVPLVSLLGEGPREVAEDYWRLKLAEAQRNGDTAAALRASRGLERSRKSVRFWQRP